MRKLVLALTLFMGCLMGPGWADNHDWVGNNHDKTYTFQAGDQLSVVGNENKILVLGSARLVSVVGNNNQITIDADLHKVDVMGNGNTIFVVDRPGRTAPSISELGTGNQVEKLVPKP